MQKLLFTICLVCLTFTIQNFSQNCGEKTNEIPATSTTSANLNGETVKYIKGKLLFPDGSIAKDIVVELYLNPLQTSWEKVDALQIEKILNTQRLTALYIESSGKFCFRNIKNGNYLLRINTRKKNPSDVSELSTFYVFVKVDSNHRNKKRNVIEINFSTAI